MSDLLLSAVIAATCSVGTVGEELRVSEQSLTTDSTQNSSSWRRDAFHGQSVILVMVLTVPH